MQLTDKSITKLLFVTQGVGAAFVGLFLASYLAGLPSTNVLHSDPIVRAALEVLGITLLVLVLITVVMSAYSKRS